MYTPEAKKQLSAIRRPFTKTARKFVGTAILAPTMQELADAANIPQSQIPKGGTGKFNWTLKALTGLDEIHRGIILGDPESVGEVTEEDLQVINIDVENLAEAIEDLPEEDRSRLLERFTTSTEE